MRIVCLSGEVVDLANPLPGSVLKGLRLHRAIMERALFVDTVFESCDLRSALFALSCGTNARFLDCMLALAEFQAADLSGVHLEGCDLYSSDFTGANLGRSTVVGSRLELASFRGACLDRADLTQADLTGTLLEGALYTPETRWPAGFDPTTSGAVLVGDRAATFRFLEITDGEGPDGG